MVKKETIERVIRKIKKQFKPQKIILFGSYAWGKPTDDSDLDIFLIMDSNLRRDLRAHQVQKVFSERKFPLDVIVYTPQELEMSLKRGNLFIREILEKGVSYD